MTALWDMPPADQAALQSALDRGQRVETPSLCGKHWLQVDRLRPHMTYRIAPGRTDAEHQPFWPIEGDTP